MGKRSGLAEDDLDAGYCPFCGVFVDGDYEEHWCPSLSDVHDEFDVDYRKEEEEDDSEVLRHMYRNLNA